MKKVGALLLSLSIVVSSFATSMVVSPPLNANAVFLPIGTKGQTISLMELSKINIKTFEILSGQRLNFIDRVGFKMAQRQLDKSIKTDGTIHNKKLIRFLQDDKSKGFHVGGFALGFFLDWVGVLIAYLIKDDIKRNRVKWAWIGFAVRTLVTLALIVYLIQYGFWP